jgi:hypothetical protein
MPRLWRGHKRWYNTTRGKADPQETKVVFAIVVALT